MTVNPDGADSRGYLKEPFRLFHLSERGGQSFPYHYHEFHKVIALREGEVNYQIEGRLCRLRPGDLLLVPAHAIHQPVPGGGVYHRIVLWIQPEELERRGLEECFLRCQRENTFLLEGQGRDDLFDLMDRLDHSLTDGGFGAEVLSQALFLQLMVLINRQVLGYPRGHRQSAVRSDPKIDEILAYINRNLTEDLSVDGLSARFFLSRSWLMHRFKEIVGCTIHQYVLQKRLILAAEQLRQGESVTNAAANSGFSDYSTFLRAFRKIYGVAPRDYR